MGLMDDILDANVKPSKMCLFYEFVVSLNDENRKDLEEALADQTITSQAIFVACRKYGYTRGESVLRRHRRRDCACR